MAAPVPWAALPPELSGLLTPFLPEVVAEIIAALPQEVPDYARPLEGAFGEGVRLGVEVALGRFLELPGTSSPALSAQDKRVYFDLGRGELRQGRELQTLLAAYRVGARVAFRLFAAQTLLPGAVIPLAESVFAYIDELSATSAEGYAQEQSARAGEVDRRRTTLLALLLSGTADGPSLTHAAAQAGWRVPERAVVVVLPAVRAEGLALRLGRSALVGLDAELVVAVVPSGPRRQLDRLLRGYRAAVAPTLPWAELATGLALARQALTLVDDGLLDADPAHVADHLALLVVHRDPELAQTLISARLAPLTTVKDSARERLAETLLAWLQHRGERQHVAAALNVHPQTVGYRLGQLRELFGDDLDDPQARLELQLALLAASPSQATH